MASSSPGLPSLKKLASHSQPRLGVFDGSPAAKVPNHVPSGFTSAADVLESLDSQPTLSRAPVTHSTSYGDEDSSVLIVEVATKSGLKTRKPKQAKKAAAPKKPRATIKKTGNPDAAKPQKRTRKPAPRKSTTAQTKDDVEDKDVSHGESEEETMSRHFAVDTTAPRLAKATAFNVLEPLALEPAMPRKVNWTPPTSKVPINLDLGSSQPNEQPSSSVKDHTRDVVFGNLLDKYGCEGGGQGQSPSAASSDQDSAVLRKRKLVELVATRPAAEGTAEIVTEKLPKKKAPKKKPRTITALATAAYKVATQVEPDAPTASIQDYFPSNKDSGSSNVDGTGKNKPKPHTKKTKTAKKKIQTPKPILLSPTAALRQVADQDFVFGTSSQLAREQSPTFWQDVRAAVKASKNLDLSLFDTPLNSDTIEPVETRPKLWDAGARDAEGELLDLEVIDLVGEPLHTEADPFGYGGNGASDFDDGLEMERTRSTDANDVTLPEVPKLVSSEGGLTGFNKNDVSSNTGALDAYKNLSAIEPEAAPAHTTLPLQFTAAEQTTRTSRTKMDSVQSVRPSYEAYTDARLLMEITKYGFKPVKRRSAMIALLDQCWEGKSRMDQGVPGVLKSASPEATEAADSVSSHVPTTHKEPDKQDGPVFSDVSDVEIQEPPPSAQPPPSPKRPRGRPRKEVTTPSKVKASSRKKQPESSVAAKAVRGFRRPQANSTVVIEIADSASDKDDMFSELHSSSPESTFSPPASIDISLSLGEETDLPLNVAPTDNSQESLFSYVLKAITTAPRSTDPVNPSWHEKILLYDPVVLEDLTSWLNSGQLTRVGFDGEISPAEVKQWCESKSVCCLWRVSLRGKERKRY
ncbi:hypothetical protein S40285_01086 [Stachybotrys chlorohalonatus IBT 40285]|uniref:Structure-specific endonuclease subunit SLX4 n=1 Tax=Stachybotrys chlorohalonatus (strain IBT 40285) TaxID=1283841 RepID=A0A084QKJ1_STAC4|nr:hypothetical protein S40285_01086 [Stachybotrys chlorohalonata IBT 40285]